MWSARQSITGVRKRMGGKKREIILSLWPAIMNWSGKQIVEQTQNVRMSKT
jgi:hypothetical protein